jgi:thiamine biosynthesis protein ThiS
MSTFTFNGETRSLEPGLTVAGLVASLDLDPRGVAIERNLAIVPRSQWQTTELADGDNLELVHFVGGGR